MTINTKTNHIAYTPVPKRAEDSKLAADRVAADTAAKDRIAADTAAKNRVAYQKAANRLDIFA